MTFLNFFILSFYLQHFKTHYFLLQNMVVSGKKCVSNVRIG